MPTRNAPGSAPGASGNDPLAELARLIGQTDPFAEYGRQNAAQRIAAPLPAGAPEWSAQPAAAPAYAPPVAPPPAPEMHPAEYVPPTYGAGAHEYDEAAEFEHQAYDANMVHADGEHQDFYDDIPPRRRMGILAIAAVFALAVVGTAGAYGYRALFGSSGSSGPPPVIKADTSPSKIVPANSKDAKNGKLIYDRVADREHGEKLVSREEQPVDVNNNSNNNNNKPAGVVLPPEGAPSGSIQPALGSGVIGAEPKKVHTIAIRPDGTAMADAAPGATVAPPSAPGAPPPPQSMPMAAVPPAPAPPPAAHAEPPQRHAAVEERHAAPPPRNAPLSLNPNAAEPARKVERPVRTAAVAAPTQLAPTHSPRPVPAVATSGGGYAVQLAARHNEADAQASFHSLQSKFPQQLGGRQPMIRRVDLGAKGVYYRAMVGPFGSSEQASQLCSSIKAAGGSCFVQKI